jgi:hypothetical protein
MRPATFLLFVSFAACASSGSSSAPPPAPQTVFVPGGANLRISGSDESNVHTIPFSVDQVWRALPGVFDSLGVPLATIDPKTRVMGNPGFKLRGRLKNVPLSRYIDCGNSTQIGSNADNYDVSLTVLAETRPGESNGAKVIITFQALAKPANFSQEYSQCSSRGVFESRFVDILNARLQR